MDIMNEFSEFFSAFMWIKNGIHSEKTNFVIIVQSGCPKQNCFTSSHTPYTKFKKKSSLLLHVFPEMKHLEILSPKLIPLEISHKMMPLKMCLEKIYSEMCTVMMLLPLMDMLPLCFRGMSSNSFSSIFPYKILTH